MDTAAVVADHAAERVAAVGRRIGAEGQMMLLRRVAQRVEAAARLHASEPLLRVERHDPVEMAGEVDHACYVAALPGEARAAASRDDWVIMLAAVPDGPITLVAPPLCPDADRHLAV